MIVRCVKVCLVSDDENLNGEETIAETCGLELIDRSHMVGRLHTGVNMYEIDSAENWLCEMNTYIQARI